MSRSRTFRTLIGAILTAAALVVGPSSALAAISIDLSGGVMTIKGTSSNDSIPVTCNGVKVKVGDDTTGWDCSAVNALVIRGGAGDDTLDASGVSLVNFTTLTDVRLYGGDGYDGLTGWMGAETLNGGKLGDALMASYGDDTLIGGSDKHWDYLQVQGDVNLVITDTSMTGLGTDSLQGIEGLDVTGGPSANIIDASGFSSWAYLRGQGGNDTITGGSHGMALVGGPGGDTLIGGPRRDDFTGDDDVSVGNDTIIGGGGRDSISASLPASMVLTDTSMTGSGTDSLSSIEEANLETRANSLTLNASAFSGQVDFRGSLGNDTLIGGSGDDFFNGVDGTDVLDGNAGTDQALLYARGPVSTLTDSAFTSGPASAALQEIEYGRIWGTYADETMDGSGFTGRLELTPWKGTDVLVGNGTNTRLNEFVVGVVTLTDSLLTHDTGSATLSGVTKAYLIGSGGNDRFNALGFSGPVEFRGSGGNDRLIGGPKADVLWGDDGRDRINGAGGRDKLYGNNGNDTLNGGRGRDGCNGGRGTNRLISCERIIRDEPTPKV